VKTIIKVICCLTISVFIVSCNRKQPLPAPTLAATEIPTPVPTPLPSSTLPPVPTYTPAATVSSTHQLSPTSNCNRDRIVKNIKADFPYTEFSVNYNSIQGIDILSIWFVDPSIDPQVTDADIEKFDALAIAHSASISQKVNNQDECIESLFTIINPIVVDSAYHGWFSGSVELSKLPKIDNPTETQMDAVQKSFQTTYLRQKTPQSTQAAPNSSCTWEDTRANIQRHFDPERANVSFQFILDESTTHVDAQWDSDIGELDESTWWALQMAAMLNVATELNCLFPAPTALNITVVDSSGKIELIGTLPEPNKPIDELDINKFQVLYQDLQ
jgi:hypothetical protein